MRIRRIQINEWRHFQNIDLRLDEDAALVCIVGANGTGKSHLLELIAACAHRLGLAPGIEIPRGDPFSDPHDFSLQFYLAPGVSDAIDQGLAGSPEFAQWDRTLSIKSRKLDSVQSTIEAGGITDAGRKTRVAGQIIERLNQSKEVHFLSLDADRAYPKQNLNIHQMAQAFEIDWGGVEYTRGRSFRPSSTLYDEWIRFFLAQENQSGTQLLQDMRRARKFGGTLPEFNDPFEAYAASLQKVLPHVVFTGVDSKKRTLLFDTTGLELTFSQLSGGEREIAFLVGQIDRFGLRKGVFLIDEPELHLNADLIRTWVGYLTGTIETGQIWLATHSLEAAEAAGQKATFILERNEDTRKVDSIARLDTRPVLSALSRAVGAPAFSISQLVFVFVEGEEGVGERERFRKLSGLQQNVRFMECGSSNEVLRRVAAIKTLAYEADVLIHIGGVVDRDFSSLSDSQKLANEKGVHVLSVHEVENFFLHPETLAALLHQNGRADVAPIDLIRDAADARAGSWIFQHAMANPNAKTLPDISVAAKDRAKGLNWASFEAAGDAAIKGIIALSGFGTDDQARLRKIFATSEKAYRSRRVLKSLWRLCEGKQVLNDVARAVGFADSSAMIQATFAYWERNSLQIPDAVATLRQYLEGL